MTDSDLILYCASETKLSVEDVLTFGKNCKT